MGLGDKFKMVKSMADMQSGAIKSKLLEFEKKDQHFKEKEIEILGKYEKKMDAIDAKLDSVLNELKTITSFI